MITSLILALVAMVLIAFFAGIEIAFLAASLVKIELKTRQNSTSARILSYFKKNMSKILITILIGNNLALMLYSQQLGNMLEPIFEHFHLSKATTPIPVILLEAFVETACLLVIAEYIPKSLFGRLADWIIYPSAYILQFFYWIFLPFVWFADFLSKMILKIFKVSPEHEAAVLNRKDLDHYIFEVIESSNEGSHISQLVDTEILENAMSFNETKTREFQIPRTQIVAMPITATPDELYQIFNETKHSRIIIYGEDMDDIRGYVHIISMFQKPQTIEKHIQPVLMVPEMMSAQVLIKEFAEKRRSVAIVVDEFGGTSGLITMEDVMEEIFGEIDDEHDEIMENEEEDIQVKKLENGTMLIGARQEVYDLNEEYLLNLPESDAYTTIGGLIIYHEERIPAVNETIRIGSKLFTVVKATSQKLILLRMEVSQEAEEMGEK